MEGRGGRNSGNTFSHLSNRERRWRGKRRSIHTRCIFVAFLSHSAHSCQPTATPDRERGAWNLWASGRVGTVTQSVSQPRGPDFAGEKGGKEKGEKSSRTRAKEVRKSHSAAASKPEGEGGGVGAHTGIQPPHGPCEARRRIQQDMGKGKEGRKK